LPVECVTQLDQLAQFGQPPRHGLAGQAVEPTLQAQQLGAGLLGVERCVLECDADPEPDLPGLAGNVIAGYQRAAAGRRQEGAEHAYSGGLTRAVRSEEAVDFAGPDPQVDVVDGTGPVEVPGQASARMAWSVGSA